MAAAAQFCVVTIGADHLLMPLRDGTRLVEIVGRAARLDRTYSSRRPHWQASQREEERIELEIVRPEDIAGVSEVPAPRRAGPRLLTYRGGR